MCPIHFTARSLLVSRPTTLVAHCRTPLPIRSCLASLPRVLVLLLSLLCFVPHCLSESALRRQQHNVWYSGLFISGIAVDESSGDVFFSDAAGNRVVHQLANGTVVHVYGQAEYGFFSPMQLAYGSGTLYVADSNNNRVAVIDVASRSVTFSSPPYHLRSCSALWLNSSSGELVLVDGWGLATEVWLPHGAPQWASYIDLSTAELPPQYMSSVAGFEFPFLADQLAVLTDPTQPSFFTTYVREAINVSYAPPRLGATAIQRYVDNSSDYAHFVVLSQPAADEPMHIGLMWSNGTFFRERTAPGRGGAAIPFYGWAMHVDSNGSMYISDHGVDRQKSPYGRVVKLAADGTEQGEWSMADGVVHSFSSVWYAGSTVLGRACAFWMADSEKGMVRVSADGSVVSSFSEPPVDMADNSTARLTGMAGAENAASAPVDDSALVLLDTSSPVTTKLLALSPRQPKLCPAQHVRC